MIGARHLVHADCRAQCMRFSSTIAESLYEALGVRKIASSEEIKAAFRKKAKAHHPDVIQNSTGADFAVILRAYQVLSDPAQRELYDLQHDASSSSFLRRAASQKREHAAGGERVEWGWDWMQDMDPQNTRPARTGSNVDRLRAEMQAEFRDALLHAYHGPRVDMSDRRLPDCFEADERTDANATDVLQLLSGRQLLGVVRERHSPLLADAAGSAALLQQAALHQIGSSPECNPGAGPTPAAELAQHSSSGSAPYPGRRRRRRSAVTGRMGGAPRPTQRVLELLFGEDELAAVGVQHRVGRGASTFEVYEQEELIYRETDGRVVKSPGTGGGGRQTHRAVLSNTPFVNHLDFVAVAGIGGLKKERVICRAKRAWLPPSATWLFKPRNSTHTSGGWYFEWVGWNKHSEHPAWLHPHAMVLRAAFETLDEEAAAEASAAAAAAAAGEEQAAGSEAPHGLWTRLKSKLGRGSG